MIQRYKLKIRIFLLTSIYFGTEMSVYPEVLSAEYQQDLLLNLIRHPPFSAFHRIVSLTV